MSRARPAVSQAVLQRHIVTLLCHIATQTVTPIHDKIFVSRLTPDQAMRARAPLAPACRPAVSQGLLVVSWPPAARPSALCHDTIYCIVTQTGKWAVAHSSSYLFCNFFFHSFFFPFVPATIRPQKKYFFFFMSSIEPNKFI